MKKIIMVSAAAILCVVMFAMQGWTLNQISIGNDQENSILVEIDYGKTMASRKIEVPFAEGRTILEVLQTVAKVETHPVGKYVIVTAIDGVEGKRGQMAWYYKVDGKSPDKIAYSKPAFNIKHVTWSYKEDVCSRTVDSKNTVNKNN